jgi:hypothetical protein
LTCGIPDLELDGSCVIEGDCLGEESGADGGFPVVIELVLDETEDERTLLSVRLLFVDHVDRLLEQLRTFPTADSPVKTWSVYKIGVCRKGD